LTETAVQNDSESESKQTSKNMEESLEKTTRRRRDTKEMLEAMHATSVTANLAGNITDCNEAALQLHHYTSKSELIGKSASILLTPKDRERFAKDLRFAAETGRERHLYSYALLTKEGQEIPAQIYTEFVRDSAGKPIAFVARAVPHQAK
jgi:PAS domain S-box-containing protein